MGHNQILGADGEELVRDFVEQRGMRVLDRNWRCAQGELDLVAEDVGYLVAIEVKTRSGVGYGHPAEAVNRTKIARLNRLLRAWALEHSRPFSRQRIDVAAVTMKLSAPPSVDYYSGVTL
ncbi:YraN family protein [Neomicrococcus aestuarii]|uniref:UPF0102 protein BHE16_01820 n=1 Tax=Neomicrococcus aestuarii TaxID=556325 RepID=A0A1L2ZLG0_9MICC|nr:YraN family protein [Neomicrococcus aestuarii]APF39966.1 hypothetical protein BHE16_01820 [Neomicrococcus aestuarii]